MSTELLPCPFCGKAGLLGTGWPNGYFVSCSVGGWACGVEMNTYRSSTKEEAAVAWNRRAEPHPVAAARRAGMEEAARIAEQFAPPASVDPQRIHVAQRVASAIRAAMEPGEKGEG